MKKECRKRFLAVAVMLILASTTMVFATAQSETQTSQADVAASDNFPEKPIDWLIAAAAGNPADIVARILAPEVQKYLPNNQPIVIQNKPGAAGIIALGALLNAQPDGYTWCSSGFANVVLTPHNKDCPYDYDSFQPVKNIFVQPQIFVVKKDTPYNNFAEWVDWVKANPNSFRYGVSGAGTIPHITGLSVSKELNVSTSPIIYKSEAEVKAALLGGHIDGSFLTFSGSIANINDGSFKPLAYTTLIKSPELPNLPNLKELNLDFKAVTFNGIFTSKDIPKNRLAMIVDAFDKALADPAVIKKLEDAKISANATWGPEEFAAVIEESFADYTKLLTDLGLMEQLYPSK